MKYLLIAALVAGAMFLGIGTRESVTTVSAACTSVSTSFSPTVVCPPNVPAACAGMVFDHQFIGTDGNDVIRITGSGRWFIDAKGGNDFIAIQAFNGPNCIVGGSGIDSIVASPFHRDVCVLNSGLNNTPDAPAGSESGKDWAQFCKTVTPSPYPPSE